MLPKNKKLKPACDNLAERIAFSFLAQPQKTVSVQKAKVIFAYEPEQEDELRLELGDIIVVIDPNVFDGWIKGELNGKSGLIPDNFVELLPKVNVNFDPDPPPVTPISSQRSVKRAAKQDPGKQEQLPKSHVCFFYIRCS